MKLVDFGYRSGVGCLVSVAEKALWACSIPLLCHQSLLCPMPFLSSSRKPFLCRTKHSKHRESSSTCVWSVIHQSILEC
ncbi:hypothetical protein FJTKL_08163 [Diaporthe vaccinii]|uniref:Uncharacterized protein n=1 Tax=Diaporthe vaccinii TaxID=105482 RepID=A0ABR4ETA6_9PEZI